MPERSPSHDEFRYEPEDLGLNMTLAEDAELYTNSEGIRSLGHLMLSLRQIQALRAAGTISDVQFDRVETTYNGLISHLWELFDETGL